MPGWVIEGCLSYQKRLPASSELSIDEIPLLKRIKNQDASPQIEKEGEKMLGFIPKKSLVVALERTGKNFSSIEIASLIDKKSQDHPMVCFLIGGPEGLSSACLERAEVKWSLSALTLPHPLARLVLCEAIYRAYSINQGMPYHK